MTAAGSLALRRPRKGVAKSASLGIKGLRQTLNLNAFELDIFLDKFFELGGWENQNLSLVDRVFLELDQTFGLSELDIFMAG